MSKVRSKADSTSLHERLFRAKEQWHNRQARMSLMRKIKAMDRMLDSLPNLPSGDARMIPTHNRIEAKIEAQHEAPTKATGETRRDADGRS